MSNKGDSNKNKRAREEDAPEVVADDASPPLTIPGIKHRIQEILARLPSKEATAALAADDVPALERWCRTVRQLLRHYNLTLNFVAIANYQWEPDRPGHTGQSLGALSKQISLSTAQTNIVSSHVNRVLTPTLERQLTKKRTVQLENGDKEEVYVYENLVNDPEMLQLNREQLCAEAVYKRQLLVSAMEQMCQCMDDYQKAEAGAAGGDGQRFSMAY